MTDRYARVYYDRMAQDPKFDGIRNDRDVMGSWLLLLIEAEKAWPAPAFPLPAAWVPNKHFRLFVERGIVDVDADGRFRVHGLDKERAARSSKAKDAADSRWDAKRNAPSIAPGNADASAANDASTRAGDARLASSPSLGTTPEGGPGGTDDRQDLEAFLAVRFRAPSVAQRRFMDDYVQVFDVTGPERAAGLILRHPDDPIGALKTDLAAFRQQRIAEAQMSERPAPQRRRKSGSGFTGVNAELAAFFSQQYAEDERRYQHNAGGHNAAADPNCPLCRETAA